MTAVSHSRDDNYTSGDWTTEPESAAYFDQLVESTGMFTVHHEVEGRLLHSRPYEDLKTVRIDRILIPRNDLKRAGWNYGPVGVEIKCSGKNIGRPLGQLLDYARSTFRIGETYVVPQWHFLWPMEPIGGPLSSVLQSHRCGGVSYATTQYPERHPALRFWCGRTLALVSRSHTDIRGYNADVGRKVGSR